MRPASTITLGICLSLLVTAGIVAIFLPRGDVRTALNSSRTIPRIGPSAATDPTELMSVSKTGSSSEGMVEWLNIGADFTAFGIKVYDQHSVGSERITVGSRAPLVSGLQHAGGDPIPDDIERRIRIVCFWASWHPLSVQSVRRLSELQREYGDRVFVMHITEDLPAEIQVFLQSKDPQTGQFRSEQTAGAVLADPSGKAQAAWLQSSMFTELPAAFLVGSDGILQWFGAAGGIERPLRKLAAGEWTTAEAAVQVEASRRVYDAVSSTTKAARLLDAVREASEVAPEDLDSALMLLDASLESGDYRLAAEAAEAAFGLCGESADAFNSLAWVVISGSESRQSPSSTALKAALRAVELSNHSSESLETLARVHVRRGELEQAVAVQREAVAQAASMRKQLQQGILRDYERMQKVAPARR